MPVPFSQEVTTCAADLLAGAGDGADPFEVLRLRFPQLHPILVAENLEWTKHLFSAALRLADSVRAGLLTQEQALDHLQSSHRSFGSHAVAQALAHAQKSA